MKFSVPQFIEHEPKIVGPLTFKQFIFVAVAGAICFFLYFSLAKKNFFLFLLISIVLMGGAVALAFLKIGGRPLITFLGNSLKFFISPKLYTWQRKDFKVEVFKKEEKIKIVEKKTEELPLRITKDGRLKKLRTEVETTIK